MYYWLLAAVIYIVGADYTYKKERWEYKQTMIHYTGDRPDTIQKPIHYVTDTTEFGDVFKTGEIQKPKIKANDKNSPDDTYR